MAQAEEEGGDVYAKDENGSLVLEDLKDRDEEGEEEEHEDE